MLKMRILKPKKVSFYDDELEVVKPPKDPGEIRRKFAKKTSKPIDCHTHHFSRGEGLEHYREKDSFELCALALDSDTAQEHGQYSSNGLTLDAKEKGIAKYAFASLDVTRKNHEEELKGILASDYDGLGEIKLRLPLLDQRLTKAYKQVGERGLPVVIHCGEDMDYPITNAPNLLSECKNTNIVFHGTSWWDELETGFVERVLENYENAYCDLSGRRACYQLAKLDERLPSFLEKFSEKLLFGTDYPCLGYNETALGNDAALEKILLESRLQTRKIRRITRDNFLRLIA